MRNINYDPDKECKQAVIFARVSTDDQFKTGDSIPAQVTLLEDYCKNHNLKLILSNSQVNEKNLYFSINKPFNKLLFSKGCKTWYTTFNEYQTNHTDDLKKSVIEIDNNTTILI